MDIRNEIVFTTAFVDIGRSDWPVTSRNTETYFKNFCRMIDDGFEYPLIVYTHTWAADKLRAMRTFPSNIVFVDVDVVDTFLKEPYLSRESEIMRSDAYIQKVVEWRRTAPEHTNPRYTLLTHSKLAFLNNTRMYNPKCMLYAWIDFGYDTTISGVFTPRNLNTSLLQDEKIYCGSVKLVEGDRYVTEEDFLESNQMTIYAFSYIIHRRIFDEFYALYEAKLHVWQRRGIADDEQNLLYQLYQDRKDLFTIFKLANVRGFYSENLNAGATAVVLHPVMPSDTLFAITTPAVECSESLHISDNSKPLIAFWEPDAATAEMFRSTVHRYGWATVWLGKGSHHRPLSEHSMLKLLFLKHISASKQIVFVTAANTLCCRDPVRFMEIVQASYPSSCIAASPTEAHVLFTAPFSYLQQFLFWGLINKYTDLPSSLTAYIKQYPDRFCKDTFGIFQAGSENAFFARA